MTTSQSASRTQGKEVVGRERILEAAAELFVRNGYAATSTRQIATKVGIQQPSLYYHFSAKSDILAELLLRTTTPSLRHAEHLAQSAENLDPLERLTSLIGYDVRLLCQGEWNLGSLYLLPEVSGEEFKEFRATRQKLKGYYESFVAQCDNAGFIRVVSPSRMSAIVFSLVEAVILRRSDHFSLDPEATAEETCHAALRVLDAQPITSS